MRVGDIAPDFELSDHTGTPRRLSEFLADGPVVLFFFPAALTPGCTREACHFRDLAAEFAAAGVARLGISRDPVEKQKQFADLRSLDFPLLSDPHATVARAFGVERGALGRRLGVPVKRWTFAIDRDRTIVAAIHSEIDMNRHADEALAALTGRGGAAGSAG